MIPRMLCNSIPEVAGHKQAETASKVADSALRSGVARLATFRTLGGMANPFQGFAYRQCNRKASVRPLDSLSDRIHSPATNNSDPETTTAPHPKRARRQSLQPSASPVTNNQQEAALAPDAALEAAVLESRSLPASKSPNGPAKKRKAYASLTGPPKGLGPKLGTSPLRLIFVSTIPPITMHGRWMCWQALRCKAPQPDSQLWSWVASSVHVSGVCRLDTTPQSMHSTQATSIATPPTECGPS